MIYQTLQAGQDVLSPWRLQARGWAGMFSRMPARHPAFDGLRVLRGTLQTFGHAGITHRRPDFEIGPVRVGNRLVEVEERVVAATPYASLVHIRKQIEDRKSV